MQTFSLLLVETEKKKRSEGEDEKEAFHFECTYFLLVFV